MPSTPNPSAPTRLEALTFEPDRVSFILDGRAVSLPGDDSVPAAAAFRALHRAAIAEYQRHPPPLPRPGIFSQLKSWITKLFEDKPPKRAEFRPAQSAGPEFVAAKPRKTDTVAPETMVQRGDAGPKQPTLSSIQSTRESVYLTWQNPSRTRPAEFTITCRLDSDVGARLQDCYAQLTKLGYPIQSLHEAPHTPAAENAPAHAPKALSDPHTTPDRHSQRHSPAPPKPPHPNAAADGKLAGPVTLHVEPPSHSAGAEAADDRLTHLRGTLGKTGLKIVEVGLGAGPDNAPLRWEKTAEWLARRTPAPAPAPRSPHEPER